MKSKFNIIIEAKTKKGKEELNKVLEQKGFMVSLIATKTKIQDDPPIMQITFKGQTAKVWRMVMDLQKSDLARKKIIENNILNNMFNLNVVQHFKYKWVVVNG